MGSPPKFWQSFQREISEISRRGRSRGGCCPNLSQVARQICAKLRVFGFVHHRKGAQNCRKFVANFEIQFGLRPHYVAKTCALRPVFARVLGERSRICSKGP